MGQTHTLNSNQTPGPLNAANKTYRMPPYLGCLDSDSSTAITPDIGPESEHEMDSELELPRPLNSAETTTRRRRPSDTIGDMYTVAEGSSDGSSSLTHSSEKLEALEASGINEVFAKRREKMYCLAERVQGMSPRAYRHPQSRTRREVRARDQDVDVDVANKHARDSGHGSNTKCRTIKENFAIAVGGGIILWSPIVVIGIGFICLMKIIIFLAPLCILEVTQIRNDFAGGIEILLEGVYFTVITLVNFWNFINLPNAFLWGLFFGTSLILVVNMKMFQVGMRIFMEETTISLREKLRKEALEKFLKRPVTSRAVSKLVSLGRNDITLADLVMLDEMQSEGGLNPMTVQILDEIRKAVLEDVEGQVAGKEDDY